MLSLTDAIILGFVQGITEWLPISSSGHLVIFRNLIGLDISVAFDVMLHFGSLIVILAVFWKEILKILKSAIKLDFKSYHGKLFLYLLIGTFFTTIIAFPARNFFESFFFNINIVALALLATGTLLFFSEKWEKKRNINAKDSVIIGIMQGLAFIPGISRSGATISTGLLRGVDKEKAVNFSFILAIPVILGATLLKIGNVVAMNIAFPVIAGTLVSIVVGYVSLKLVIKLVLRKKLHYFAIYCFAVGLSILFLNFI